MLFMNIELKLVKKNSVNEFPSRTIDTVSGQASKQDENLSNSRLADFDMPRRGSVQSSSGIIDGST
jgi:hypothetical protein